MLIIPLILQNGAVRAGKTVDNVYAFAHELKTTPDKIHLATGSTSANAKLNIGDANGFGLEYILEVKAIGVNLKVMNVYISRDPILIIDRK